MPEPLATWRPAFRVFALRFAAVGLATALLLSPLPYLAGLTFAESAGALAATLLLSPLLFGFLFDDHVNWLRHRRESWALYRDRLEFRDGSSGGGEAVSLPLARIERLSVWLAYALDIRMEDGLRIMALYIPDPAGMKRRILAQRDALPAAERHKA